MDKFKYLGVGIKADGEMGEVASHRLREGRKVRRSLGRLWTEWNS